MTGRMSQTSNERLREYLAQLPIQSQALLMREFERAIERGEDTAVASLVLEQLRNIVRRDVEDLRPRSSDLPRLFFSPLDPFVVDGNHPARPGQDPPVFASPGLALDRSGWRSGAGEPI